MSDDAFPDVRWGRDRPWLNKPITAFTSSRSGSWIFRKLVPYDHKVLVRSRGRYTILGPVGVPLLLLNTVGAKSGERRTNPLTYMRDGNRIYLVGSNFGQEKHPAWSWNLLAKPDASVSIGGVEIPVTATQLHGDERERAFAQFVDFTTTYENYTGRTDRDLRVFALDRR
ncbi:nitroreductase/quinone reductase family protein [Antrihabitans sp. NCIMB 15449]|uniref:Nitroreductase/quinone reductase family protein n=1 Tax=Antrihabitans spumae TaxID=3373370 RepID=A0ABW7JUA7_9NOCA